MGVEFGLSGPRCKVHIRDTLCNPQTWVRRVVLRWNCAKVIANIDDLAISIWASKVIDELSQIDDI